MKKKTKRARPSVPTLTREAFRRDAEKMRVRLGRHDLGDVEPREFQTGSVGWKLNDRITHQIGDELVMLQVTMNVVVIGSKRMPDGKAPPPDVTALPAPGGP